ncbi:MAG: glycerate kinase [Gemmatimonadota bacterium]|nr:glycerate kinase [Gemmatimonadota bacterium]
MAPLVVVLAQPFKGSLTSHEVGVGLSRGVAATGCRCHLLFASDGGDGLLEALALERRTAHRVTGPRGAPVDAEIGWLDPRTAVVESRLACGLALLPSAERDPTVTTTRGVGELVGHAAAAGARAVFVGIGGSATMDGGLGLARAWGWEAMDAQGVPLPDGGGALSALARLVPGTPPPARLVGLADVRNPLLGAEGAAVYAAQKGAAAAQTQRLVEGLARLVTVTEPWGGPALAAREGAGAAGGLGFGLLCFGGARLEAGAAWVLDRIGFAQALKGASLVLVAEGSFDATSLAGKLVGEAIARAQAHAVPAAVVAPRASARPPGVVVESGGESWWDVPQLAAHASRAVRRALKLPPGEPPG